jgi:hypothetical protein
MSYLCSVKISWDIFRILADYRLRHLVKNVAIHIYAHDYIRMEIYVICVCLGIVVSNTYYVVLLFCFSSSYVPYVASFSGLSFLIVPSVLSNFYVLITRSMKQSRHGTHSVKTNNMTLYFDVVLGMLTFLISGKNNYCIKEGLWLVFVWNNIWLSITLDAPGYQSLCNLDISRIRKLINTVSDI